MMITRGNYVVACPFPFPPLGNGTETDESSEKCNRIAMRLLREFSEAQGNQGLSGGNPTFQKKYVSGVYRQPKSDDPIGGGAVFPVQANAEGHPVVDLSIVESATIALQEDNAALKQANAEMRQFANEMYDQLRHQVRDTEAQLQRALAALQRQGSERHEEVNKRVDAIAAQKTDDDGKPRRERSADSRPRGTWRDDDYRPRRGPSSGPHYGNRGSGYGRGSGYRRRVYGGEADRPLFAEGPWQLDETGNF